MIFHWNTERLWNCLKLFNHNVAKFQIVGRNNHRSLISLTVPVITGLRNMGTVLLCFVILLVFHRISVDLCGRLCFTFKIPMEKYKDCCFGIRNHVTKLRHCFSIFRKTVIDKTLKKNPSKYWQAIKPYMTGKIRGTDQNRSLFHGNMVVDNSFMKAALNVVSQDKISSIRMKQMIIVYHAIRVLPSQLFFCERNAYSNGNMD